MSEDLDFVDPRIRIEMLEVDSIIVGERYRQVYENIDELADSIRKHGLMHCLVVDDQNRLVAGGRRLAAVKSLGWKKVQCMRKSYISDLKLREMELDENIQREDMTWQEEVALKDEIVRVKIELYGEKRPGKGQEGRGISQREIAEMLGESPANLSIDRTLAQAMKEIPELSNCKTKDDARKKLKQIQEKAIIDELSQRAYVDRKSSDKYQQAEVSFVVADAIESLKLHPKFDYSLVHVDTPYGIDLNRIKKTHATEQIIQHNYIEWDLEKFYENCSIVATECFRIVDNSFMVWWFAIQHYQFLYDMLIDIGWEVDPMPAIWFAGEANAQTNHPEFYLGRCYEPFFVCRKGKPILQTRGRVNLFNHPKLTSDKKIHPTEKPLSLIMDIYKTFSTPGANILSPFLGSGNDILAAIHMHRSCRGWDLNDEVRKRYLVRAYEMFRGYDG